VNEGSRLAADSVYPNIAADFQDGFDVLKVLPCDLISGCAWQLFGPDGQAGAGQGW
jgi:hypothetical protein